MVEQIHWPFPEMNEPANPFVRVPPGEDKEERPLRLTFHTESLVNLSGTEQEALQALYELSNLPVVEAFQTKLGQFPHLEIAPFDATAPHLDMTVNYREDVIRYSGINNPSRLPHIAALIVGQPTGHPNAKAMFDELIIAEAHNALHRDLLVTASPLLIKHRSNMWLREANPRTPSEAAHVLGLFLRSQDNFTTHLHKGSHGSTSRSRFYWNLVRMQLKRMQQYFSACMRASKVRADDTEALATSIFIRCSRALQACDFIGQDFYSSQGRESEDRIMYHFDYLTLLLAGAFDAQARIAYRVYKPTKIETERGASFRHAKFRKALKACGANELHKLASQKDFQALMTLLYELRNKIHGSVLEPREISDDRYVEAKLATVPLGIAARIWTAAETIGTPKMWGLSWKGIWTAGVKPPDPPDDVKRLMERLRKLLESEPPSPDFFPSYTLYLEPYAFSLNLIEKCFEFINLIAEATDVTKLFDGHPIPPLTSEMPKNKVSADRFRNRVAVLGGISIE